jgi:hypothetical protein
VPPAGRITGAGPALAVSPAQNNTFKALNRAWKAGLDVQYAANGGGDRARYLLTGLSETDQAQLVNSLGLVAERVAANGTPMKKPRIGLYRPGNSSMDEGWTRWVIEQYGFEYISMPGTDIQAGGLKSVIDVLVITDENNGVIEGGGRGGGRGGPAPGGAAPGQGDATAFGRIGGGGGAAQAGAPPTQAQSAATGAPPQAGRGAGAGGRGAGGAPGAATEGNNARVAAIEEFVRGGGTVVCFNRSSNFAITQFKLPVKNTSQGLGRQEFFASGSLLKVIVNTSHPVMAGMPVEAAVFFDGGPVFETLEGFKGTVLASYPAMGSPLASGYLLGEKYLNGKAAALDVELGSGHFVLLGFRPQWRGQPFGTFRVIFNSIAGGVR